MKKMVARVMLGVLGGGVFGMLAVGLFAYLVAGPEGLANGVVFGAVPGMFAGIMASTSIVQTEWLEGISGSFGRRIRKKDLEDN